MNNDRESALLLGVHCAAVRLGIVELDWSLIIDTIHGCVDPQYDTEIFQAGSLECNAEWIAKWITGRRRW